MSDLPKLIQELLFSMSLVSMLTEQLRVNRDIPRHECPRPFVFRLRMTSTHNKQKINVEGIFAVMNTT